MNQNNEKFDKINLSLLRHSQEYFLHHFGVSKSFLTYHNFGSSVSEYLEIGMPYMILYESLNTVQDQAVFFEFTEGSKNTIHSSLTELKSMGERSLHSHDFYELTVVLSGEIVLQIEDERITYHAGECCLCNKNIHHREIFETDFEIVLFLFQEDYIQSVLSENLLYDAEGKGYVKDTFFNQLLFKNKNGKIPFLDAKEYVDFKLRQSFDPKEFFILLNSMILEISENKSGKNYMMKGYFCRFFSILENSENYAVSFHHAKLSKEEALLYRVSLLLEKKKGRITRQELEDTLNYNADYINRIVKKRTGMPLSELGQEFMLKEASDMLKETDLSISSICEKLGYSNRSFFYRLFEERYKMKPTEYRKQYRK